MRDDHTSETGATTNAADTHSTEGDSIRAAREYGIDIGLINSLLDVPVLERIRRNDADLLFDRMIRHRVRSHTT
jgi:hypothetical protein